MAEVVLKFTKILRREANFYLFKCFENVKPRGELPCEYLSGPHFAVWNGVLLYSDGENSFSLIPGNEVSEDRYQELMQLIEKGKGRLKEINERNQS
jgi:hypothetical protein